MRRSIGAGAALALLVGAATLSACSNSGTSSGTGEDAGALTAGPSPHCAPDGGDYDAFRAYLAETAADEPWIDRVLVCAGGTLQVDQSTLDEATASREALTVCTVAAGYLITKPPPPERAGAPNPREIGVIVTNQHGDPVALGAEDEISADLGGGEGEREREREAETSDAGGGEAAREAEPFRCFNPFA